MQKGHEHIDRIFVEAVNELYSDVQNASKWRKLKSKLILQDLFSWSSDKMLKIALLTFIFFVIAGLVTIAIYSDHKKAVPAINNIGELKILPGVNESLNDINSSANPESIQKLNIEATSFDQHINFVSSESAEVIQLRKDKNRLKTANEKKRQDHYVEYMESRNMNTFDIPTSLKAHRITQEKNRTENKSVQEPKNEFEILIGASYNADIKIDKMNESVLPSVIHSAGLDFKYQTEKYYIESSVYFSHFKYTENFGYFYDTLIGQIVSARYEIVPIVNDLGDTVLRKIYEDALIDIYDTLKSKDQLQLETRSTLFRIPISVGINIYHRNNFSASVFGGVTLNVLINKQQTVPEYSNSNQDIVKLDRDQMNSLLTQFYLHGGVAINYQVSKRMNLVLSTSYNYGITSKNIQIQPFTSSLVHTKLGFLIKL
jgi:hypothetical protein